MPVHYVVILLRKGYLLCTATTPCMSTIRLRCSRLMLKHGGNIPGVYIHVHRVSCGQLQAAHNARHVWTFIHAT